LVISTALYLRQGSPYLARGVVGDVIGLALLAGVLLRFRRRARHEAALCLACVGVVLAAEPEWPLRVGAAAWWGIVTVAVTGYLLLRHRVLRD
jgi:hypothetical protein